MVVDACVKWTEALEVKNMIAEQMLERQKAYSVENMLEILYELPGMLERWILEDEDGDYDDELGLFDTVRDIGARYQRSLDTVQRKLDVLSALLKFTEDTLRPQEGEFAGVNPVLRNDYRYWPYFRDCIGALDGTHVQDPTMNVLAICNFDMKFIYAYLGVPGRAHDTMVLTHCARDEASFLHPPPVKYFLVDSGYPTRTAYLGPHRSMRYHLRQFARGGPPVSARELFNRNHSGLRSVIERKF
ncbi:uncharacterized protein LOC125579985 [Brassica napus]|uniref:uncharacterized protein LOC125579985 n=1 Tax=Brassica napus TaxID=3708 RepID=UPI0020789A46|nr:uncharacterized protein LOC125579985 [Brassica napus]